MTIPEKLYKKFDFVALAVVFLLSFGVYAQTIGFGPTYCDDVDIVVRNVDRISGLDRLGDELMRGYIETSYYRPIVNASFVLESVFVRDGFSIYHLTNVILHFLACFLIYKILSELGFHKFLALAGAAIYSVHPIFANAVAWIVGRNDLLYSLFCLLSFYSYLVFRRNQNRIYYALTIVAYLFAVGSKETALIFPLIFGSFLLISGGGKKLLNLHNVILILNLFLVIGIWDLMRHFATLGEDVNRYGTEIFLRNLRTLPEYVAKFFLPVKLSVLPTFSPFNTFAGLILAAGLLFAILSIKSKPTKTVLFGAIWFAALTLPTTVVTVANSNDWNEYLECRSYLPIFGLLLIVLELFPKKYKTGENAKINNFIVAGAAALVLALGISNLFVSRNYANPQNFYENAVKSDPDKALFNEILANLYADKGEYESAEKYYEAMVEANPDYAKYKVKFGRFLMERGKYDRAVEILESAIETDSLYLPAYNGLSSAYLYRGDFDSAADILEKTIALRPDSKPAYYDLIAVQLMRGDVDGAKHNRLRFADRFDDESEIYDIFRKNASHYFSEERDSTALEIAEYAVEIDPNRPEVYRDLAIFYLYYGNDLEKARRYRELFESRGGSLEEKHKEAFDKLK